MNVHLHRSRTIMGWLIGIAAFSPFVLCLDFAKPQNTLSDVTGRVTYSGQPLNQMIICLDVGGVHSAFSMLNPDGSFRLRSMTEGCEGASRGRYHAHLFSQPNGPSLPAKFSDPTTSGVEIDINTDWSDLSIDLH
jgi:hypothetical protein